jgi:hypothetical protein
MYKSKFILLLSTVLWATTSLASHAKPEACPSINSIQAEGVSMSSEIVQGVYLTYNLNHYNTSYNWVFILGPVLAKDDETAIDEGNKSLSMMSGNPSPEDDGDGNWICEYTMNSDDMAAFAVEADDMISPLKMTRYFRKGR